MISEEIEFQLSQYLDGGLRAEDAGELQRRLTREPELVAALAEFRRVNDLLKIVSPMPEVKWNALADHISNQVTLRRG